MSDELEKARLTAAIESAKRVEANDRAFKAEQEAAKLRAVLRDMATGSVTVEGLGTDPPADAVECLRHMAEVERELRRLREALPDMTELEARQQERMNRREGGQIVEDCEALLVALRTERARADRLQAVLDEKVVKLALLADCTREIYTHEARCGACVTCLQHKLGNAETAVELTRGELHAWRQVGGNQSPEFWADHLSKQVLESAKKDGQIEKLERELRAEQRVCDGLFEDGRLFQIETAIKQALLGQPAMVDFMALLAAFKSNQRQVVEVNRTFNLQRSRMGAATRLWQKATGRTDTWPDLGDLLAWLMKRAGKERKIADLLGKIHRTYRAILFPSEREAGQDNISLRVQVDGLERELQKLYGFSEAQTIEEDNAKIDVVQQEFTRIRESLLGRAEKELVTDEDGDTEEGEHLEHCASIWKHALDIVAEVKRSGCVKEEPCCSSPSS